MIIGLDVSTSIIGISLFDLNGDLLELTHIDLHKLKNIYEKANFAREQIKKITSQYKIIKHQPNIQVFIEQPLKRFMLGKSSASTITLLAGFNMLISYFVVEDFGVIPEHIDASSARKTCGIKIQKGVGTAKEQTFVQVREKLLPNRQWLKKKNSENYKDYCYDESDAYIIGLSATIKLKKQKNSV